MDSIIDSFGAAPTSQRAAQSFVKAGDTNNQLYQPQKRYNDVSGSHSASEARESAPVEKKKRAIDELKEELAQRQSREQRSSYRGSRGDSYRHSSYNERSRRYPDTRERDRDRYSRRNSDSRERSSYEDESTNLFVNNISSLTREEDLYEVFSNYGALASIKIIRPFSKDDRQDARLGFVAFLSRKSAERALEKARGIVLHGNELGIGWGKPVPIPSTPMEPPRARGNRVTPSGRIKISAPAATRLEELITQFAQFVWKEGTQFENLVKQREANNRDYEFLRNPSLPEYLYYRWRIYSFSKGDSATDWDTGAFQFEVGGDTYLPPLPRRKSSPERSIKSTSPEQSIVKVMTRAEKRELEDLLSSLTGSRSDILMAMGYFMRLSDHADSLCSMLADSIASPLSIVPLSRKIASLYLISDILHNSSAVPNASKFRNLFQVHLPSIFEYISEGIKEISGRISAKSARDRVIKVLKAWDSWALYPVPFLRTLESTVNQQRIEPPEPRRRGHGPPPPSEDSEKLLAQLRENHRLAMLEKEAKEKARLQFEESFDGTEVDGEPIGDSIDGIPMDEDIDIDGEEIDIDDLDGVPIETNQDPSEEEDLFADNI